MARKNQTTSPINVGLDIGYGVTKAVTLDAAIKFPSVWGAARVIKFSADEISQKYPGDILHDDEGEWFLGDLALSQLRHQNQRRLRGRTLGEATGNLARRRMMKAALGKLYAGKLDGEAVHVRIATGLPVDHMLGAAGLKAALLGQHHILTNAADFVANVVEVMVMPQPYGTIYNASIERNGKVNRRHVYTRTGVCDVGTYTIDAALDDNGEYIDAESGSVEAGVHTAQEAIISAYERDFGQKPDMRTIENALKTGIIRAYGDKHDYRDLIEQAVDPIRAAALELLNDKWQAGANVDIILLSGGGAELVFDAVRSVYRQAVLVEDAQMANARGYLNYALFTQGE